MNRFKELFDEYKKEAFRLELLPQYKVEGEWDEFQDFLKGKENGISERFLSYLEKAQLKIKDGARHIRARVLSEPLTDYERFEIETGYKKMPSYGIHVKTINKNAFLEILDKKFKEFSPKDFWVFDEEKIIEMNYDKEGQFVGFEVLTREDSNFEKYLELKDELIKNAREFLL